MVADGRIANPENAIDTAVVLPSEDLFIELLHSLPSSIPSVNITMGYPMKLTPAAALMRSVMTMHLKARKIRGSWCFFYEDVCDVLANPLLARIAPEVCEDIRKTISRNRMFSIPADELRNTWPTVENIFYPVDDLHSGTEVFDYTLQLVSFLEQELKTLQSADKNATIDQSPDDIPADSDFMLPPEEAETPAPIALEVGFLSRYRQSVEQLRDTASRYRVNMRESTFFHMIRSVVDAETVSFTGEPLKGLQIMGILETKSPQLRQPDNIVDERTHIPKTSVYTFVHTQHTATLLWHGYHGVSGMHFRVLFLSHDIGGTKCDSHIRHPHRSPEFRRYVAVYISVDASLSAEPYEDDERCIQSARAYSSQ